MMTGVLQLLKTNVQVGMLNSSVSPNIYINLFAIHLTI